MFVHVTLHACMCIHSRNLIASLPPPPPACNEALPWSSVHAPFTFTPSPLSAPSGAGAVQCWACRAGKRTMVQSAATHIHSNSQFAFLSSQLAWLHCKLEMQPYLAQSSPVLSGLGRIPPPRVLKKREGDWGWDGETEWLFPGLEILGGKMHFGLKSWKVLE